ncbi:hypothetical protein GCM10022243_36540 [Saccharothrix violaceirubra]
MSVPSPGTPTDSLSISNSDMGVIPPADRNGRDSVILYREHPVVQGLPGSLRVGGPVCPQWRQRFVDLASVTEKPTSASVRPLGGGLRSAATDLRKPGVEEP